MPKRLVILSIMALIAALHIFGPARMAVGFWHDLYYSYFSDLAMPFAFYFLLCAAESQFHFLRRWWIKAILVFGLALTAEILQGFGIYALGRTFDPWDVVMYALGVLLAVAVERGIFARRFSFWNRE